VNIIDLEKLKEIRQSVLISMFADDYLMDKFVLKGGSALQLGYKIDNRSSIDIDLSMEDDITNDELDIMKEKIHKSLQRIFDFEGYVVFDYKFEHRPKVIKNGFPEFWGGYGVEFKLLLKEQAELIDKDIDHARNTAEIVGNRHKRTFKVDISKYEYCRRKKQIEIFDYTINIYTPEMLVIEKLRALCQQMKEYKYHTNGKPPRTRDIYDIYVLMEKLEVSLSNEIDLIKDVFAIKEVPVELLTEIQNYKTHYLEGLQQLSDTIPGGLTEEKFNECFDFVVNLVNEVLETTKAIPEHI
jgi:predicted nucleotidyltransferase component of viral defense system